MTEIFSSGNLDQFAPAMAKAQAKMPVIGFDASAMATKTRGYKYATLGAIIEKTRPILAEFGFSVIQQAISDDSGVAIGVRTVILHESGQYMSWKNLIRLDFEAHNVGQEAGKLITYLRRYSLAAALNLYADEDTDNTKEQTKQQEAKTKVAQSGIMTIEKAYAIEDSEGTPYGELSSEDLSKKTIGIAQGLKKTDLTDEQREFYQEKLDAIKVILKARNEGSVK